MEEIFLKVQELLAAEMPELSLIDEDYGQLETTEDIYPVTFPCLLINLPSIEWSNTAGTSQEGVVSFTARLAIDCYHDTHHGSTQEEGIKERILMYKKMNGMLHGFSPEANCGQLLRRSTRLYSLPGAIKVYESDYSCSIKEVVEKEKVKVNNPTVKISISPEE